MEQRAQGSGQRAQASGLRAWGSGLWAQGSGLRARGAGRRAKGKGQIKCRDTTSRVPTFNLMISIVPLFHCSIIPLFHCSIIPLFHCSIIPTFHCSKKGCLIQDSLFFRKKTVLFCNPFKPFNHGKHCNHR